MSNTRVRVADGTMTTVYVIRIRPAVGLWAARRERDWAFQRGPFSTRRNFLATHIRQHQRFRVLPLCQRALMGGVVLPAKVASLVSRIRASTARGLLELAAIIAAVALPSIIRLTDEEASLAPAAAQLEEHQNPDVLQALPPLHPAQTYQERPESHDFLS